MARKRQRRRNQAAAGAWRRAGAPYNLATFMLYKPMLQSHIDGYRRFAAPFSFFPCTAAPGAPTVGSPPNRRKIPMATTGTVKFFNADKGYGFIAPDGGGNDAFVHITAVERAGMRTLDQNQRVQYELEQDKRGKTSAVNLQPAD